MDDDWVCDRRTGRYASKTYDISPVEFRSVLRLRPLQKKEKDDHVVLDVQKNKASQTCTLPSVIMRALPRSEHSPSLMSPEFKNENHEHEFRFDAAFGESSSQDADLFGEVGRPMSTAAMEPLFLECQQGRPQAYVNIAVGPCGSGKTYTCWGNTSQSLKRKLPTDGMIPRMADSLFGQFQRLSSRSSSRALKKSFFAVNISALQVNHPKNPKSQSNDAGKLYDLLQFASSPKSSIKKGSFERNASIDSGKSERSGPSMLSEKSGSSLNSADEKVYIDQDPLTHDFRAVNSQVRSCRTSEEARETLQEIISGIRKVSNKRNQCHVLVQMQPVLIDHKTRSNTRTGNSIVFLDMAGSEDIAASKTRHRVLSKRMKDSLPGRCDAHASVVHCLRSMLFNEQLRQGKDPKNGDSEGVSAIRLEAKMKGMARAPSLKQVPYLQHKITMLLQPFFSPNHSDRTVVTMLVTASASHRDYMEKRMLLEEIETLWKPFHRVSVQAATGLDDEHDATKRVARPVQQNRSTSRSRRNSQEHEVSPKVVPIILHAPKVEDFGPPISIASSGSSDDYSLPPPIAPPTPSLLPAEPLSYRASAPLEEDHYQKYVIPMDTSKSPITDFPDAIMGSGKLPSEVNEPTPGSLYSSDQMNSLPIPKPPAPRRQVKPSKKSQSRSVSSKKLRARSRSPLRPAPRAGNELTRAASESSIVPEKTHSRIASSHNGEFPKKKKWSRTVETTTTVVESSDDPLESHTPNNPATTRKDEVGLPSEMDNLRRQNETLQRELAMLRSKSRKSVTWRDDNALDDDHAHAEQHNRSTSGYEANKSQRSHSTMRSGRLMDTPVLREQMARYKSTSSERNRPEVYSINQAGTGFENSHYPDRSRNRRPWED